MCARCVRQVHAVLRRLAAEGATVVLSSHRMDDLEALCAEVTILATGRVVFSGPVKKLADEDRDLDYRLRASDPAAVLGLAAAVPGVALLDGHGPPAQPDTDLIVLRARVAAMDELISRMVHEGIAVRELAPVTSPLETAFLALTEPTDPAADPSRPEADR